LPIAYIRKFAMFNRIRHDITQLFDEPGVKTGRRALSLAAPALLFLLFHAYLIMWHVSLVAISTDASLRTIIPAMTGLFLGYALVAMAAAMLLTAMQFFYRGKRRLPLLLTAIALALFIPDAVLRCVDWGTIYFSGSHIDREFWYHAFYVDSTYFLKARESRYLLAVTTAVCLLSGFIIPVALYSVKNIAAATGAEKKKNTFTAYAAFNIALMLVLSFMAVVPTLVPAKSPFNNRDAVFVAIPEVEATGSFVSYVFLPEDSGSAAVDRRLAEKLEKCGVRLNTVDDHYPLLKKSIYLDKTNKTGDKPHMDTRTNIVIVFVESLSAFLLQEEIHGVRGLTPNMHRMMAEGCTFTRMYGAAYPTIRGIIATLGSSLYNVDHLVGIKKGGFYNRNTLRPPIMCKFLFLSDILKEKGYYNIHAQGGSGNFSGMDAAFVKYQHYDAFHSRTSRELLASTKRRHMVGSSWGIWDEDVFAFAVQQLKEGKIPQPFLLTISTLDLHPPFINQYEHPAAKGNKLLNCLYSTDRAFGVLYTYLRSSAYRDNTLILLVADHMQGANAEYEAFSSKYNRFSRSWCDYIAAIMYVPGNPSWRGRTSDTFCSNLDIAPTILDMMDIDLPNPFLGLSIFSERPLYPLPVTAFNITGADHILKQLGEREKAYIREAGFTDRDQQDFLAFNKYLLLHRAIYP
jgi:hypothetical protein